MRIGRLINASPDERKTITDYLNETYENIIVDCVKSALSDRHNVVYELTAIKGKRNITQKEIDKLKTELSAMNFMRG